MWNRGAGHTGAMVRGGNFNNGTKAGPLAVNGNNQPSNSNNNIGFRCARELPWPGPMPGGLIAPPPRRRGPRQRDNRLSSLASALVSWRTAPNSEPARSG